jgi:prophage antirepressor-like protein
MDIVKAFNNNNLYTEIIIQGTYEEPLFRASDIGNILDIINIRKSIIDYNDTEKKLIQIKTNGGLQQVLFLTEKGLYKLLFKSKKNIANEIQDWVCDVIKEIRLNGKYELEKQLKEKDEKIEEIENHNKKLIDEAEQVKLMDKIPVIYIYNIDTRNPNSELKIGCSQNYYERIKPYRQTNKFGKIEFTVAVYNTDLKKFENYIQYVLNDYKINGEVFRIDVDEAILIIMNVVNLFEVLTISNKSDRILKLKQIQEQETNIIKNIKSPSISMVDFGIQTDFDETNPIETSPIINTHELYNNFDKFVETCCIVRHDVEDSTVNLIGQYRIWSKTATKESYLALLSYLKTKFKPVRLKVQNKNSVVMGYEGLKLKNIEYIKKSLIPNDYETFIFHKCIFTFDGKVLFSTLYNEFIDWKNNIKKPLDNNDEKELKKYLKSLEYIFPSTIWTSKGNGIGYYGLVLKSDEKINKKTSCTGKMVEKRDAQTNELIETFETIAKAAESENIAGPKMSRSIKNKVVFNDDYYYAIK